jgi:hypothetical protein
MSLCKCFGGYYGLLLSHTDCRSLLYEDLSTWENSPGPYQVGIRVPGNSEYAIVNIDPTKVNKITTVDLGIGIVDGIIPDGIYCFRVDNCGTVYEETRAVLCNLFCKYDSMVASAGSDAEFEHLGKIRYYLDAIAENARRNKTDKAQYFYKKATELLNCVNCNCS